MKAVLIAVLLVIAYALISNGVGSIVYLLVRRPDWPITEYAKVCVVAVFTIALSVGMVRFASHWWARWRTAFGWIAVVIGLGGVFDAVQMSAVISEALLISSSLGVAFGVVLLLWPKFFRTRTARS